MKVCVGFLCLLLWASCSSGGTHEGEAVYTVEYRPDEWFDWNTRVKIQEVIPLETSDSCVVGYASRCLLADNRIVYVDPRQKVIFVFDRKGTFRYKIDARGEGDKEYRDIRDVIISHDRKQILVLDPLSVLAFDLETGAFLSRISLDAEISTEFFAVAQPNDSQFYFWSTNREHGLYVYEEGRLECIRDREGFGFISNLFYYDKDDRLMLLPDYGRFQVSRVEGCQVVPAYTVDFGKWTLPEKEIPINGTELEKVDKRPFFKCLLSACEAGNILLLNAVSPEQRLYHICIDWMNGKVVSGHQDEKIPLQICGSDGDCFYAVLYPHLFTGTDQFAKCLRKASVGEESNPVIILFTL